MLLKGKEIDENEKFNHWIDKVNQKKHQRNNFIQILQPSQTVNAFKKLFFEVRLKTNEK